MTNWENMTQEDEEKLVRKMQAASHLLPDPGGEVVRDLLHRNNLLRARSTEMEEALKAAHEAICHCTGSRCHSVLDQIDEILRQKS